MSSISSGRFDRGWRRFGPALLLALALLSAAGCRTPRAVAPAPPALVLVSLDGFRWDYLDRGVTPALSRLAADGARATRLTPIFPTKTFPNHHSIATGLGPADHGVVANNIYDPELDRRFSLGDREAVADGRWYGGEPIWVTARRQGRRTAALFWPGTEAEIAGWRPAEWTPYDHELPGDERVDRVLGWLARPAATRPELVTLYFSLVDDAGHQWGPAPSTELAAALAEADRLIARLVDGISRLPDPAVNLVVVSDHGMAPLSPERMIFLDDYVDVAAAGVVDWSPIAALWPREADRETVYQALAGAHPALAVYRRQEIPARYGYRGHRRIPPILAVAEEGWSIATRDYFEGNRERFSGGNHGYDNRLQSMAGIFVAAGPSIRAGVRIERMDALEIYPLLCRLLRISPAPGQGIGDVAGRLLRGSAAATEKGRPS